MSTTGVEGDGIDPDNVVIPSIFGLLLFGFALGVVGTFNLVGEGEGALVFSAFVAGMGEVMAGSWEISRGETYIGTIMSTFGIWLIGLFLLFVVGETIGIVGPTSLAIYFLVLLVPVALMYIPAYTNEMAWPSHVAFAGLFLLVLFTGISFLVQSRAIELAASATGYVSAFAIWWLALEEIRTL